MSNKKRASGALFKKIQKFYTFLGKRPTKKVFPFRFYKYLSMP